jgi:HK97 family phage portal protein
MRSLIGAVRSTLQNKTPVPYASRRFGLPWASRNDAESQMKAMGSVSTLFAIVHRTSNATSSVGWKLWRPQVDGRRRTATGQEESRTEVTRHAALDLWTRPNRFYTRQLFVETIQQHIDLVGEGVIVLVRSEMFRSLPLELWPVRPDRIEPVPHPTEFLSGYVYTGPNGERVPLQLDEVIHVKMPNPLDPYRGLGPVQAAMVDLDSARYSAEWNRNFFINSAEPGGVIEVDKRLDDDEFDEMTERWREQHQGVSAAHRVAIIEQGTWKGNTFTQRDMQFAELRGISRELIREAFGIHGHMIGNSENVNKANAEAGEISFGRWLTRPRCERIQGALNSWLLPMYGEPGAGLEFGYVTGDVVPLDREADDRERTSRSQAWATLVDAGADPDDAAAVVGLPPMRFTGRPAGGPEGTEPTP